jgi:SAM-dependent MidA family methyltransferase
VTALPTWREAWENALYGPDGFYLCSRPGEHFRTSVHASPLFAEAILALARANGLDEVVDVGAGGGELLSQLHAADPGLRLTGVDLAPRPPGLPAPVCWRAALPASVDGLVLANEWLDNVPCDVVQVDAAGVTRLVHVDPATGAEELGAEVRDDWLDQWWPLHDPGTRAEVGRSRDDAWGDLVRRIGRGLAIAVDYGHTARTRPRFGSLTSYQRGRQVEPIPDGIRDLTAHVAVDSLQQDRRLSQRDALRALGVHGTRPPMGLATTDPEGYVRALSRASQAAELTAAGGLGDFVWVIAGRTPVAGLEVGGRW